METVAKEKGENLTFEQKAVAEHTQDGILKESSKAVSMTKE